MDKAWAGSQYPAEELKAEVRHQYDRLRATIERVVQDVLLASVVTRQNNYIRVGKLGEVVGLEQSENDEIQRLFKRCSDRGDAHDVPSAGNPVPSTPGELKTDIADLNTLIKSVQTRKQGSGVSSP